ncbi:MAG: hypothetical protein HQM12_16510 [SAR324 cluster bacterium]|nr:hypothetical protein [SAR324 cluster bacterium]
MWKFAGCLLLCYSCLSSARAACVITEQAMLYAGPGTEYDKTSWSLSRFTPLRVFNTWNDWYQVKDIDGDSHWIHSKNISTQVYCFSLKQDNTPLYDGPGDYYSQQRTGKKYESFYFGKRQGDWTQGTDGSDNAVWVKSDLVWVQ